jgi:PAS domain S-box-containing protein
MHHTSALDLVLSALVFVGLVLALFYERSRRQAAAIRGRLTWIQNQLAYAHDAAGIGSWYVDPEGRESWSASFRALLGVDPDVESSTELFRSLVHPDDRDAVEAADTVMLNEPGDHEFEYRVIAPDGSVRWLLARGRCVVDESGERQSVHGVTLDITQRKLGEEARRELSLQLAQSQKLETIGRLVGGVAHDFSNMLTGITGYAELARKRVAAGQVPNRELDEIIGAAASASALTRQLLTYSRRDVAEDDVVDLAQVLVQTEGLLRRVIGEHIALEMATPPAGVAVKATRTQLEQIVLNLVVNARDAMPDGGRVSVTVNEVEVGPEHELELPPGRFALLAVTDEGSGIDLLDLPRIFEAFYTTKVEGTGLGLATIHGIVAQLGGTIWVGSHRGGGTTFKVYLPVAGTTAPAAGAPRVLVSRS